jgi:hypothetical protein
MNACVLQVKSHNLTYTYYITLNSGLQVRVKGMKSAFIP